MPSPLSATRTACPYAARTGCLFATCTPYLSATRVLATCLPHGLPTFLPCTRSLVPGTEVFIQREPFVWCCRLTRFYGVVQPEHFQERVLWEIARELPLFSTEEGGAAGRYDSGPGTSLPNSGTDGVYCLRRLRYCLRQLGTGVLRQLQYWRSVLSYANLSTGVLCCPGPLWHWCCEVPMPSPVLMERVVVPGLRGREPSDGTPSRFSYQLETLFVRA